MLVGMSKRLRLNTATVCTFYPFEVLSNILQDAYYSAHVGNVAPVPGSLKRPDSSFY